MRADFGGTTTKILDAPSRATRRTVPRIKLVPRTRANALGLPSRAENPAASTTMSSVGRVAEFVGIIAP